MDKIATSAKTGDRWTWDLLSSSLPLEFAIARRVKSLGYEVEADYAYERSVSGVIKEYSVDLRASRTIGKTKADDGLASHIADVSIFIECKYRRPSKAILILPSVGPTWVARRREALRGIVAMSTAINVDVSKDLEMPTGYKAVEIDFITSDKKKVIIEDELRHGLEQLQYAVLNAVVDYIRTLSSIVKIGGSSPPQFILPILVTNAPLYMAKDCLDTVDWSNVKNIDDIAHSVESVAFDLAIGPLLKAELGRLMSFDADETVKVLKSLDARKREVNPSFKGSGALEFQFIRWRVDNAMNRYFSRIIICNEKSLCDVLESLKELLNNSLRSATEVAIELP